MTSYNLFIINQQKKSLFYHVYFIIRSGMLIRRQLLYCRLFYLTINCFMSIQACFLLFPYCQFNKKSICKIIKTVNY